MTTAEERRTHFYELLGDFNNAMLVTRMTDGSLRSRPMYVAAIDDDDDGAVWFVSSIDSGKVDDMLFDEHVNVAMQGTLEYVSLSGVGEIIEDDERIASLWSDAWEIWFPEGPEDPSLGLIKVIPEHGEYWDFEGGEMFELLFEAGKAYLTDEELDYDEVSGAQENAEVDLD
jgi:general stress protein 26